MLKPGMCEPLIVYELLITDSKAVMHQHPTSQNNATLMDALSVETKYEHLGSWGRFLVCTGEDVNLLSPSRTALGKDSGVLRLML
jgi:hypothetical protein